MREGHIVGTDLDGQEEITEGRERRGREHKKDHDRAMHGHQLQVVLWRHHPARSTILRKQLQAGDRGAVPREVDSHEPGKRHSNQSGDQGQSVILLADHLVVQTEDVLPNETCRRPVMRRVRCYVVHILTSKELCRSPPALTWTEKITALPLPSSSNHQSP